MWYLMEFIFAFTIDADILVLLYMLTCIIPVALIEPVMEKYVAIILQYMVNIYKLECFDLS